MTESSDEESNTRSSQDEFIAKKTYNRDVFFSTPSQSLDLENNLNQQKHGTTTAQGETLTATGALPVDLWLPPAQKDESQHKKSESKTHQKSSSRPWQFFQKKLKSPQIKSKNKSKSKSKSKKDAATQSKANENGDESDSSSVKVKDQTNVIPHYDNEKGISISKEKPSLASSPKGSSRSKGKDNPTSTVTTGSNKKAGTYNVYNNI
ncbi:hypothetical protein RFI_04178, partial [Reticulomyxa filosa]